MVSFLFSNPIVKKFMVRIVYCGVDVKRISATSQAFEFKILNFKF